MFSPKYTFRIGMITTFEKFPATTNSSVKEFPIFLSCIGQDPRDPGPAVESLQCNFCPKLHAVSFKIGSRIYPFSRKH